MKLCPERLLLGEYILAPALRLFLPDKEAVSSLRKCELLFLELIFTIHHLLVLFRMFFSLLLKKRIIQKILVLMYTIQGFHMLEKLRVFHLERKLYNFLLRNITMLFLFMCCQLHI